MTSFPDDGELGALLAQMQQLQESVAQAQASAGAQVVEGSSAGGAVRVAVSGEFDFESVAIDPSVVDPEDVSLLEDLVLAALHDAVARLNAARREAMGDIVSGALAGLLGSDDLDDTADDLDDETPDPPGSAS